MNRPLLLSLDRLSDDVTVSELVAAVVSTAAKSLIERAPALRSTTGAEDVHQARVETRRFRARLRALRPLLDRPWVAEVDADMKWLAAAMGAVRDADVLSVELEMQAATVGEVDFLACRELLSGLSVEREAARSALVANLECDRYRATVDRLLAAAVDPPLRSPELADRPARRVLPALLAKRWGRLRRDVGATVADPSNAALHQARKSAKKLRYSAEMAAGVLGDPASRLAKAGRRLQDVLGEVHDAANAETWLRHRVLEVGSLSVAVAAGQLIDRERRRHLANRDRWPTAWKKARRQHRRAGLTA